MTARAGRVRAACVALAACAALAGCTTRELYAAGQGWQRQQCSRMPDGPDRERCIADAERGYDAYQRSRGTKE